MQDWFSPETWHVLKAAVLLYMPSLVSGFLVLLVCWALAAFTKRLILRLGNTRRINADAIFVLAQAAWVTLICFGVVTALGQFGFNVSALVAGLGLTGFALGIALKDIISNVLSGILILIYKPFQRHDRIEVTNLQGTVSQIDLRYTTLLTTDRRYLIPNATLFSNPITVFYSDRPAEPSKPAKGEKPLGDGEKIPGLEE